MKLATLLLASALAVNSQGVSERLKELTVQEEQKDADEYMLLPTNSDKGSARRRVWTAGKGPPTNNWAVDPNKYHWWLSRPTISKLRWMLFREGDEWDTKQKYRGAEVWAPGGDAAKSTKFDPSKPTIFYCEGFTGDPKQSGKLALDLVSKNYPDGINLIIIDTSDGFYKNFYRHLGPDVDLVYYPNAAHNTQDVGYQSAKVYVSLLKKHGDIGKPRSHTMIHANKESWNVQCIGGSLGAQACGRFGRTVNALTWTPVNRVTALDAAGPLFHKGEALEAYSVNKNDAYFVEGVHTNGKHSGKQSPKKFLTLQYLGLERPYGHVDYYVNGGITQPGCDDAKHKGYCSHARMRNLWGTTSPGNEHKTTKCNNYAACQCARGKECDSRAKDRVASDVKMGQFGTVNARGLYFVETSANKDRAFMLDDEPYVRPDGTIDEGTSDDGTIDYGCDIFGCTCQGMSDAYGVHAYVGWGTAEQQPEWPMLKKFWDENQCTTAPATCTVSSTWCTHAGATRSMEDCDGDGIPDQVCRDTNGGIWALQSASNCAESRSCPAAGRRRKLSGNDQRGVEADSNSLVARLTF